MRLLTLLLLIAVLFAGANLIHTRWVSGMQRDRLAAVRASRTPSEGEADIAPDRVPDGQALVLIGRPSGAEPVLLEPALIEHERPELENMPFEVWEQERSESLGDFELEVQSGQTLSEIVLDHYGVLDGELIEGLVSYNGLSNADALHIGERLRLPDVRTLRAFAE